MTTPWAPRGSLNFRDLGGLPTRDGGTVRPNRLYRSDTLQELDDEDAGRLVTGFGLRTIVDLRFAGEVETEGRGPLADHPVTHLNIPLLSTDAPEPGTAVPVVTQDTGVVGHYLGFLDRTAGGLVTMVAALADDGLPAVVHCAAGKDRTGVVVALLLDLAGVEEDAIVADYAASDANVVDVMARLRRLESYGAALDLQPKEFHRADPAVMEAFLRGLRSRHGDARSYFLAAGAAAGDLDRVASSLTGAAAG